jgi:gamma-glutamyl hydrolase
MIESVSHALSICLLLTATIVASVPTECKNSYPIIGIFSQPSYSNEGNCGGDCLYIAASYVKYIEAAGARVVPINYYADESELEILFNSLNGFLFPGGANNLPPSAQYIFDRTVEANDAGDFMPLQGTCLGFEWLLIAASRNQSILDPPYNSNSRMDAMNLSLPLDFTSAAPTSKLFANAWGSVYAIFETENVTMNNHHYGIYPSHFLKTPSLSTFYSMLSTNKDRKGIEFVSTIEAFDYPIYGYQWHPEKNTFEWGMTDQGIPKEAINHTPAGIEVAQYTGDFFVQLTRNNTHKFSSPSMEAGALIYNYPVTATFGSFVQEYFFDNDFSSVSPSTSSSIGKGSSPLSGGQVAVVVTCSVVVLCFVLFFLSQGWLYTSQSKPSNGMCFKDVSHPHHNNDDSSRQKNAIKAEIGNDLTSVRSGIHEQGASPLHPANDDGTVSAV